MVSLDKVFDAQTTLKGILRETHLVRAHGIAPDCGGNITEVHYEKGDTESVDGCFLRLEMETRDFDHVRMISNSLRNEGFKLL